MHLAQEFSLLLIHAGRGLTSTLTIGYSADGDNHPTKKGEQEPNNAKSQKVHTHQESTHQLSTAD
jgi:hypothetical protein